MIDLAVQAAIVILGGAAVVLLANKSGEVRRWGYLSGLLSEPFWVYSAVVADQWGVVILALWWGWWYWRGLVNNWNDT